MSGLQIKVRNIDDNTLFTHKSIQIGPKRVETPTKAIPIGKTTEKDGISDEARGFNEIYFEADINQLENSQRSFESNLKRTIGKQLKKTRDGEINVVFVNLKSTVPINNKNLNYLADLIYSTSDIFTIPLMPELLSAIKEDGRGTRSNYFDIYLENVQRFIKVARQMNNKPIMGIIPTLPRIFVNKIIELYLEEGIRAYCFNFNGRTVTAESQLTDMVTPLMRNIAVQDLQEDVLFYALNAHRGRSTQDIDFVPARDFMTFGFGLDILGEKHIGGNLPPHLYEKIDNAEPKFRMFNKKEYLYRSFEYGAELEQHFPRDTGLNINRILNRPQDNHRLATLLNGEQQAKETDDLKPVIDEYRVLDHIERKEGIKEDNIEDMRTARLNFEGNKSQSSLSELDDLVG